MVVDSRPLQIVESSLLPAYHRWTLARLQQQQLAEDAPHTAVPDGIIHDPRVLEAVRDMIGEDAVPDDCRHVHLNTGGEPGDWHADDYCGQPWPAGFKFAILAYFPQDTTLDMGPTAARADGREIVASGPAGTCLLIRQDVEHRATANTSGRERYMLKYLFRRSAT